MSDRGSILISTANDIGEALVEKLGGEGYAPSVWDKEYNKLGIAEVDSAPALSVLEDSSETGTARGSILLSTANAIGAMLNKKYNTDRGFKPKEWASAASKLAPLPQKSAESASICAIEDGADDVPTKSLIVTIPPTLSGTSLVSETQTGRNLFNVADYSKIYTDRDGVDSYNYRYMIIQLKPNTTYTVSQNSGAYSGTPIILINNALPVGGTDYFDLRKASDTKTYTTDSTGQLYIGSVNSYDDVAYTRLQECKVQIEYGSTAHAFEPYQTPTQYTANLGRTIYGGTADIVNGTGTDENNKFTVTSDMSDSIRYIGSGDTAYIQINKTPASNGRWQDLVCSHFTPANIYAGGTQQGIGCYSTQFYIRDSRFTSKQDFLDFLTEQETLGTPLEICYKLATPTDFTFDGQEIPTRLGYNAFWSDQGNTALDYYGEPEPYTRGTASGAIANVQSARTDLPFTKVKANIAPNLTGVSEVKVFNTGAGLVTVPDVSGSITNAYFYNISTGFTLTAGVTYKITMVVNSTVTTFAVSVGVGDDSAYRYDIYNTGIINKNGVVSFEFTPEASHLTTWDKLWIRAPRYSDPSGSQQTTCTFTVTNILLYTSEPAVYTADLGEPINGGSVDFVSGEVKEYPYSDLGTRSIFRDPNRTGVFYCALPGRVSDSDVLGCNKYAVLNIAVSTSYDKYVSGVNSYGGGYIFFRDTSLAGLTDAELTEALTGTLVSFDNGNIVTRSIPGQVIVPSEGVNNLWNNAGGDTEVEYFEQE